MISNGTICSSGMPHTISQNQKHIMSHILNPMGSFFLTSWFYVLVKPTFFSPRFPGLYHRDKITSAQFEWNLIVLLHRQGKDCISMKWAIDLNDESPAPGWACHAAQFR